ncbi:DSD1 family PLP-dependent enzyme [Rhodoplanes serenus]|uniref:DSD1 family PLP-dependent enzyme n=1 Tax=Rhodoplanes serenus TaxID=200615 RepID=A0A9X4XPG2_9BRAD|nr:alanine racemase [Rhodoplanes serenus]MTW18955.1 DSD1 family PLP-dependent enzyme [Rhodoplanes serenus]
MPDHPPSPASDAPRWRDVVPTPALVLDRDALDHNIALMAAACREAGVALRPHAKTHKCSRIAARQIAAGACGIACATLDEAEVMVAAGLPGVLITSPVVGAGKPERLARLAARAPDLLVVADHPDTVAALDRAVAAAGVRLGVLVDADIGHHRTGVAGPAEAVALARAIAARPALRFAGVQGYAGHIQHIGNVDARRSAAAAAAGQLAAVVTALTAAGLRPAIVTGAGTGTHRFDAAGPFTELQAGSYTVMDAEYGAVDYAAGEPWPFRPALAVAVTVVSANVPGQVTTDGGTKAFALNGPLPRIADGPLAGAAYAFRGDEHGCVTLPTGAATPPPGTVLTGTVPHCDPTIAHYDAVHVVQGDRLVDVWAIDARGRRPAAASKPAPNTLR